MMRVPDKIQGLSIPEYHRQMAYYAGAGRTARADDAFARIGADADSGRWSAAGRFAGAVEDAAGAGEKAYDDYQSVRAAEAYTAFQTAMRERMYGENGIFTRQGEAAFNSEEELENAIRDTVDEMTERMKLNRDAHLKLARSVFGFSSQALPKARRYAADQRLNWANRQDMASIELNRQEFLHNADERNARLLNLITMQEAYNRYAARNGFSAEQKEFGWKKVRSITYSQLAETFINSGNLNAARKLVDEDGLWMADDRDRIGMRIRARDELLRAREEAEAKSAEQRETRKAVRSAVRDILKDSDGFPSLEEQRDIALGRADALRDPALRQRARREIERELDWRMLRRDARTMRAMLDFRSAARNEGLSPEQRRERLEQEDMPEDVRAALYDELERGEERMPDEQNMSRAMNLLRFIDTARAGGRAPTADDILAAGLRGGLTDGQVEGALAYLENDGMLSLSHLDDICLDLGMAPDEHGEVRAPAWLYEGVLRDLARNGQTGNGIITDEMLANSATRVRRRHDARIAAGGADVVRTAPPPSFPMLMDALRQADPDAGRASGEAFIQGYGHSVSGLMMGGEPEVSQQEEPLSGQDASREEEGTRDEPDDIGIHAARLLGQMIGDAPALLLGGTAGRALLGTAAGAAGASLATTGLAEGMGAAAGAGALTEGLRAAYIDAMRHGEVENRDDFLRRAEAVSREGGKGAALNLALLGAGQGAAVAARGRGLGSLSSGAAGVGAEGAVLAGTQAAAEKRMPSAGDFADAALMVLGGRASGRLYRAGDAETRDMARVLQELYVKRGLSPEKAAELVLRDPTGRAERLLEEGRRNAARKEELRAQGRKADSLSVDFTDYRSAEQMAVLRGRLASIQPEEQDFIKQLKPKDASSRNFAQRTADNLRKDLQVETSLVETAPGVWALRVESVPPAPSLEELRPKLRAIYQAMKQGTPSPRLELGVIGPEEAARIRRCTGQETLLQKRVLLLDDIEHANGRHGKEAMKGQADLREEDFVRYAEVVLDPDWIEKGRIPGSVIYMRRYPQGTIYAVEQSKSGKQMMGRTMWRALPGAQPEILLGLPEKETEPNETARKEE